MSDEQTDPYADPYWDEDAQRWVMGPAGASDGSEAPPARPWSEWLPGSLRSRGTIVIGVAAVLCAGLGFGIGMALKGGGDDDGAAGGPSPGVSSPSAGQRTPPDSALSSESASPSPSPSESAAGTPAGYRREVDPAGFTLVVPEDWDRTENEQGVFYKSADRSGLIQVFRLQGAEGTPYEALEEADRHLRTDNPGYERHGLKRMGTGESAELDYSYDSEDLGARRRVLDRVVTAPDGAMHAVLVAAPAADWPGQRAMQEKVLAAFCTRGNCPEDAAGG